MPQPNLSAVHVNRPLTNISIAYLQQATNFIADRVFPTVPVSKKSDSYFTYDKAYWHRSEARIRAPGTEAAGSGWDNSTATFDCDVIAVRKDIADQIRDNADSPLDLDRDATQWVTHQILIKREKDFVTGFFATSLWTGSTTGSDITVTTQWGTDTSTPIEDVHAQQIAIQQNTGYKPNVLVLGPNVYDALRNHPDILDRIKYTGRGIVTLDLLTALFDVERVLVPFAMEVSSAEGASTSTQAFIYGKHALLCYAAPSPGILMPSGGYIFSWRNFDGSQGSGLRIKRYRMENLASDRVEGEMAYDMKLVAADTGAFFSSVVA